MYGWHRYSIALQSLRVKYISILKATCHHVPGYDNQHLMAAVMGKLSISKINALLCIDNMRYK